MALVPSEKRAKKYPWNIKDTKDPRSKCECVKFRGRCFYSKASPHDM